MKTTRGFTLLELIVATMIMAVAIVGLLSGIAGTTRNAARSREYDRVVQLARLRMNDLLLDPSLQHNAILEQPFEKELTGGLDAGYRARLTLFEMPPAPTAGSAALDRLELEVWWKSGENRRTFTLEGFRMHALTPEELTLSAPALPTFVPPPGGNQ